MLEIRVCAEHYSGDASLPENCVANSTTLGHVRFAEEGPEQSDSDHSALPLRMRKG